MSEKTFGIGPRLGYYKSIDAIQGGWYIGGQLRLRLNDYFGVEGAVDYRAAETFEFKTPDGTTYSVDVFYLPVTVSALLFLPMGGVAPYGIAGFGWYKTNTDYSQAFVQIPGGIFQDGTTNKFGYHFGLGVEMSMGSKAAVTIDYRYLFLESDIKGPGDLTDGKVTVNTNNSDGQLFAVGLMLYL